MSLEPVWLLQMVVKHHSLILVDEMRRGMRTNGYRIALAMVFQSPRINWILIVCLYYSTQNGLNRLELCFVSGSLAYNHHYCHIYISKMANFWRFKSHKTTIGTKFDNLNTIERQFMFDAGTIGILIKLTK